MSDRPEASPTVVLRRASRLRRRFAVEDADGRKLGTLTWTSRFKDSAEARGPDLELDLRTHGASHAKHRVGRPDGTELVTIDGDHGTAAGVDGPVAWSAASRWKGIEGHLTAEGDRDVRAQTRPGRERRVEVEVRGSWPDPVVVALAAAFAALVAEGQSVVVTTG